MLIIEQLDPGSSRVLSGRIERRGGCRTGSAGKLQYSRVRRVVLSDKNISERINNHRGRMSSTRAQKAGTGAAVGVYFRGVADIVGCEQIPARIERHPLNRARFVTTAENLHQRTGGVVHVNHVGGGADKDLTPCKRLCSAAEDGSDLLEARGNTSRHHQIASSRGASCAEPSHPALE